MTKVRERGVPTRDEFWEQIFPAQEPVVFRGAAHAWEMFRLERSEGAHALLDRLVELVGHRQVIVGMGLPLDRGYMHYAELEKDFEPNVAQFRLRFSRFANEVKRESEAPTGYFLNAHSAVVQKDLPELEPMLDVPILRGEALKGGHWRMWISSGRHLVHAHLDSFQNVVFVLQGTKRYKIFPPEQYANLYPGPFDQGPFRATASMVDMRRPDLERYPRFSEALAAAAEVELRAGDVLFLPAYWWHSVETPGFTIAANYWWGHTEAELKLAKSVFLRALLHLRPLPASMRRFWKLAMDYYVFQLEGAPYEPMGPSGLDVTGVATPERIDLIERILAKTESSAPARPIDDGAVTPADPLQMSPHLSVELGVGDALNLLVAGKPAASISRGDLHLLLQFQKPTRAQDAVDALTRDGYDVECSEVMAVVRRFGELGCLVRAGRDALPL